MLIGNQEKMSILSNEVVNYCENWDLVFLSQIGPFSRCTSIRERVFRNGWSPVIVTTPTWSHRIRANYDRKTVAPDVEYCTFIMIAIAIFVTLQSFSVTCASNELGLNFSDFNIYYENYISENEIFEDRKTRRNDFVPFNSLTFKAGGVADEKYKSRLKSKETNKDKTEWWRKTNRKKMKKKKHKKKTTDNYKRRRKRRRIKGRI